MKKYLTLIAVGLLALSFSVHVYFKSTDYQCDAIYESSPGSIITTKSLLNDNRDSFKLTVNEIVIKSPTLTKIDRETIKNHDYSIGKNNFVRAVRSYRNTDNTPLVIVTDISQSNYEYSISNCKKI